MKRFKSRSGEDKPVREGGGRGVIRIWAFVPGQFVFGDEARF